MVALLDVNILIALFDASHVFHNLAHRWFARNRGDGWATCALTENAFVRISSNPAYQGNRPGLREAVNGLSTICRADDHVFWLDEISVRDRKRFEWDRVQGYRQITDVYLLALAVSKAGRLVSFDKSISLKGVVDATNANLEIIVP